MFEFQNLDVYKKAKAFHRDCKSLILNNKLDQVQKLWGNFKFYNFDFLWIKV
jgi:hypothetical protein